MKLIRIDISDIAYTEKKVPMDSFLDLKNYYLKQGSIKMVRQRLKHV